MTKIEINEDCIVFRAEPRMLRGITAYVALLIKGGRSWTRRCPSTSVLRRRRVWAAS